MEWHSLVVDFLSQHLHNCSILGLQLSKSLGVNSRGQIKKKCIKKATITVLDTQL